MASRLTRTLNWQISCSHMRWHDDSRVQGSLSTVSVQVYHSVSIKDHQTSFSFYLVYLTWHGFSLCPGDILSKSEVARSILDSFQFGGENEVTVKIQVTRYFSSIKSS